MVRTVSFPGESFTSGTVTSPAASATTLPEAPSEVFQLTSAFGRTLNFWHRLGVTSAVMSPVASSFDSRTDHVASSSTTSDHLNPRLMPPSRSPSLGSPLPSFWSMELFANAG